MGGGGVNITFKPYPKQGLAQKAAPARIRARRAAGQRRNDGRIIDLVFLAFIVMLPCVCGCGQVGGNDPNHLVTQKWGQSTRNDYTVVPMCRESHQVFHTKGVAGTNEHYGINLWQINKVIVEFYELMWCVELPTGARVYQTKLEQAV